MLVLVILTIGLVIATGLLGFTFNAFMFRRHQAQYKTDALALSLAGIINAGDRVGQMNELQEASRELVYASREDLQQCARADLREFVPLYEQLLQEAHEGQAILAREKETQTASIERELKEACEKYNASVADKAPFRVPGLATSEPRVTRLIVGRYRSGKSSVLSFDALSGLSNFDRGQGNVDLASGLLRSDLRLSLPAPDNGLKYVLSSLPAYIEGTCAPPRLANGNGFHGLATLVDAGKPTPGSGCDQIPTAVQVFCSMDTAFGDGRGQQASVDLMSTGITNGALAGMTP